LSPQEKELFMRVAFFDSTKIMKWDSDIYVAVTGNDIREGDQETIDELISEVAVLIKPLRISRAESEEANVVFNLDSDIKNVKYAYGHAQPRYKYLNRSEIDHVHISIFPTARRNYRKKVMYHEMMHALGISHPNFEKGEPRILYDSRVSGYKLDSYDDEDHEEYLSKNYKFSNLDRKIIQTL